MDKSKAGLFIVLILLAPISFVIQVNNYYEKVNDYKAIDIISNTERNEYILNLPVRGRLVSSSAYVFSNSMFYGLLQDRVEYFNETQTKGVIRTTNSYNLIEIELDNELANIISVKTTPVSLNLQKFYQSLAYDGINFYTMEYHSHDSNDILIYNLISFDTDGIIVFNRTIDLPTIDDWTDILEVRRSFMDAYNGFLYLSEYIYSPINGIYERILEQIAKFSLPDLERVDTFQIPYKWLKSASVDSEGKMILKYKSRPDKNITGYNSKSQIVYNTIFTYDLNKLTNDQKLQDLELERTIHVEGMLQTYPSFGFELEGITGEYNLELRQLYNDMFIHPITGDMWNKSSEISFDYFLGFYGFNVHDKSFDFPILSAFFALMWVILIIYLWRKQKNNSSIDSIIVN